MNEGTDGRADRQSETDSHTTLYQGTCHIIHVTYLVMPIMFSTILDIPIESQSQNRRVILCTGIWT